MLVKNSLSNQIVLGGFDTSWPLDWVVEIIWAKNKILASESGKWIYNRSNWPEIGQIDQTKAESGGQIDQILVKLTKTKK
jgi:hypothetical protein